MPAAFKDLFFNSEFIQNLASAIADHYYQFDKNTFFLSVLDEGWENYELKTRMRHITHKLHDFLPENYEKAVAILQKAVEQTHGAGNMVFPDFVEVYGLEHWDLSMQALEKFTRYGSSEFGIRPFILKDQERAMKQMTDWSKSNNHHVRRLASEGCRPRLPWAMALPIFKKDPSPILPVLENLKEDTSPYVRKSVANNLNDISKDHPDLVLRLAEQWHGNQPNTDSLIKHALRTLLKSGNTEALLLFGFSDPEYIEIEALSATPNLLKIGEETMLNFNLHNSGEDTSKLRIEYKVHYIKKNGKPSPKIFQLSEKQFSPGKTEVSKKHSFMERSTRKHYPGKHEIEMIVNGETKAKTIIDLIE